MILGTVTMQNNATIQSAWFANKRHRPLEFVPINTIIMQGSATHSIL
jgi:hypothetical protein